MMFFSDIRNLVLLLALLISPKVQSDVECLLKGNWYLNLRSPVYNDLGDPGQYGYYYLTRYNARNRYYTEETIALPKETKVVLKFEYLHRSYLGLLKHYVYSVSLRNDIQENLVPDKPIFYAFDEPEHGGTNDIEAEGVDWLYLQCLPILAS